MTILAGYRLTHGAIADLDRQGTHLPPQPMAEAHALPRRRSPLDRQQPGGKRRGTFVVDVACTGMPRHEAVINGPMRIEEEEPALALPPFHDVLADEVLKEL